MTPATLKPRLGPFARSAPADRWQALGRLARSQYGLVTAWQMEDAGFDANARQWLRRTGRVVVVRHGIYRLLGVAPSWRSSALAAVLAAGPGAVLSHRSAGVLWDLFEERNGLMAAGWAPLEFHSNQVVREICAVITAVYLARTSTSLPAS